MTITFIVTPTHCNYVVPNNLRKFKYVCFLQFYWLDFISFANQLKIKWVKNWMNEKVWSDNLLSNT